jgi:hypothetical protein
MRLILERYPRVVESTTMMLYKWWKRWTLNILQSCVFILHALIHQMWIVFPSFHKLFINKFLMLGPIMCLLVNNKVPKALNTNCSLEKSYAWFNNMFASDKWNNKSFKQKLFTKKLIVMFGPIKMCLLMTNWTLQIEILFSKTLFFSFSFVIGTHVLFFELFK